MRFPFIHTVFLFGVLLGWDFRKMAACICLCCPRPFVYCEIIYSPCPVSENPSIGPLATWPVSLSQEVAPLFIQLHKSVVKLHESPRGTKILLKVNCLPPPTKLREGNVFNRVCFSVILSMGVPSYSHFPWYIESLFTAPRTDMKPKYTGMSPFLASWSWHLVARNGELLKLVPLRTLSPANAEI